jgi:hypothetical protein
MKNCYDEKVKDYMFLQMVNGEAGRRISRITVLQNLVLIT